MSARSQSKREKPASPDDLYTRCLARDGVLCRVDPRALQSSILKSILFERPFFVSDPESDLATPAAPDSRDQKIRRALDAGCKYRDILDLLRIAKDKEARSFILVWWLKSEGIFDPEELFNVKSIATKLGISPAVADCRHTLLVAAWRPYFERLFADRQNLGDANTSLTRRLMRIGYREDAVLAAERKRSVVESICEWLAGRKICGKRVEAGTLRNAYSRYVTWGLTRRPKSARLQGNPSLLPGVS